MKMIFLTMLMCAASLCTCAFAMCTVILVLLQMSLAAVIVSGLCFAAAFCASSISLEEVRHETRERNRRRDT